MRESADLALISAALVKAGVELSRKSTLLASSDVELTKTLTAIRKTLAKHDIAPVFSPVVDKTRVGVVLRVLHSSGEWIELDAVTLPYQGRTRMVFRLCSVLALLGATGLIAVDEVHALTDNDVVPIVQPSPTRQRPARTTTSTPTPRPISKLQKGRIERAFAALELTELQIATELREAGAINDAGDPSVDAMTTKSASELISALDRRVAERKATETA